MSRQSSDSGKKATPDDGRPSRQKDPAEDLNSFLKNGLHSAAKVFSEC